MESGQVNDKLFTTANCSKHFKAELYLFHELADFEADIRDPQTPAGQEEIPIFWEARTEYFCGPEGPMSIQILTNWCLIWYYWVEPIFTCGGVVILSRWRVLSAFLGRWLRCRLLVVALVRKVRFCFPGHIIWMLKPIALEVSRQVRYILNLTDWLWSFGRGLFFRLNILPGVQHVVEGQVVWQVLGHRHAAEYPLEVPVGPAGVAVQLDSGVGWVGREEDWDWASGGDAVKHFRSQVPLVG